MATITGVVKSLTGTVKAIAADGTERTLKLGGEVVQGEKIITADGSSVVIAFSNGAVIDLGRNMEVALTEETLQEAAAAQTVAAEPTPEDAAAAEASAEEIQKALLEGKDITELEATAAGPAAGGAGGDSLHEELIIHYVGGEGTPGYGFDTIGSNNAFRQTSEQDLPIVTVTEITGFAPTATPGDGGGVDEEGLLDSVVDGGPDDLKGIQTSVTGTLAYDFGGDGPNAELPFAWTSINITGADPGPDPENPKLYTSDGQLVSVDFAGTLLTGYVDVDHNGTYDDEGDILVFTLELTELATGAYEFTIYHSLKHLSLDGLAGDNTENDINFTFNYIIQDSNGDIAATSLSLIVDDDTPVVSTANESFSVDEDDLSDGTDTSNVLPSVSGDISDNVNWGADGFNGVTVVTAASGSPYITDDGTTITLSTAVWQLMVTKATGAYTFTLLDEMTHANADGENSLTLPVFTVTGVDGDGDLASVTLTASVVDDTPVVVSATNAASVDEDDLGDGTDPAPKDNLSTTGTLNINLGADGGTIALSAAGATWNANTSTLTGTFWHVVLNGDGTYTFTLDDNTLTHPNADNTEAPVNVTFSYLATDGDGDTVSGNLTVQVVDDMPIAVDEPTQILTESHIQNTDWLPGTVTNNSATGDWVKVTEINGLVNGDTLKIDWTGQNGNVTVYWELREGSTVVTSGNATNNDGTLSAVLSGLTGDGSYDLYIDYQAGGDKTLTISDVHVLHTVTTTDSGNVITGDPGADTVGADGAKVYSITYFNGDQTVTEVLGTDGFADVDTQYGKLHIEADGDYLYTVNMNAVPDNDPDSQVNDAFTYTLMDGDGDTDTANMNFLINDVKAPNVLDVTMLTNTNVQVQPVILTFVDQDDPTHAFARLIPLGAQGQQGTFTPDTGFDINNNHNYIVGVEAATSDTKVLLTDLTIEGVPLFGQATGGGGGTIQMKLDNDATGTGPDQTGITALIQPNDPPAVQAVTDSTDGDDDDNSITDNTSGTVNYLYGADGADTLQGSSGSEILNGGAGADSLSGGAGNDILVYDANDTLLDGGAGMDVLRIDDGAMALFLGTAATPTQAEVDLRGVSSIHEVEVLLITDDAEGSATKGTTLILNANDVLNFTDDAIDGIDSSINHTLYVNGNASDKVKIGSGWATGTPDGDFNVYTQTVNSTLVTLKVETEVQVDMS